MGYRVGEHAGPYEVLQLLGRGTFGEVLLARDRQQPRHRVALKTVACDQLTSEAADRIRQAALTEAQLLQQLRHPHIVRCEGVQCDMGRQVVWLALEFMDGGDAQSLIDRQREAGGPPFEAHFLRRAMAAVGSALQYIHSEGVLHRDVKPANILLTRRSQRIKLGDFGISKLLEATPMARTVVGTPYYLAPEIVSGQAYGPAADAWALGVCLYEFAALRRPFEAGNPLALVRRICEEPPLELPQETPGDIRQAVAGLLERDPDRRLCIAQALATSDAIAALAAGPIEDASHLTAQSPRGLSRDLSPMPEDDLSPVSVATSAWGGSQSEVCAAEIVVSLAGDTAGGPHATTGSAEDWAAADDGPCITALPWRGFDAVAKARAALGADVDDPEELQLALLALEHEARMGGGPPREVHEALSCELRLRISALRADAAALLQSLLCPPDARHHLLHGEAPSERTALASPDTVTTLCAPADCSADGLDDENDVQALETAIELATSLGVDTGAAEEQAASARGLLSLRVVWGGFTRLCLLPLSIPFAALMAEVARRFGLPSAVGLSGGSRGGPLFELCWREGAEVFFVRDQVSWEQCLRRRGLGAQRAGRLELRLEAVAGVTPPPQRHAREPAEAGHQGAPFVVTGLRLAPSKASAGGGAPPRAPERRGERAGSEVRRSVRTLPVPCAAAVAGAGAGLKPTPRGLPVPRESRGPRTSALGMLRPPQLQLEGRKARSSCRSAAAQQVRPRGLAEGTPRGLYGACRREHERREAAAAQHQAGCGGGNWCAGGA